MEEHKEELCSWDHVEERQITGHGGPGRGGDGVSLCHQIQCLLLSQKKPHTPDLVSLVLWGWCSELFPWILQILVMPLCLGDSTCLFFFHLFSLANCPSKYWFAGKKLVFGNAHMTAQPAIPGTVMSMSYWNMHVFLPTSLTCWLSLYCVFWADIQLEGLPNNGIVILTTVMNHASQLQHIDIKANGAYNQTLRLEKHC